MNGMLRNDLVYRYGVAKKNKHRAKIGKPLLNMGNPKGPRVSVPSQGYPKTKWGSNRSKGHGPGASPNRPSKAHKQPKAGAGAGNTNDFLAPLTRKMFKQELGAATRDKFDPTEREIRRQQAASLFRQNQEIPAWYTAARGDIQRVEGQQDTANQQLLATLQGAQAQAGQQDASNRAAMMERLARDAALRGASLDPSIESGQVGAEAARANAMLGVLGTIGGQAANQSNYLRNREVISHQAEGEARGQEAARLRQIQADLLDLVKQKGDFAVNFRRESRKDERDFALGRAALKGKTGYNKAITAQAKLGLKGKQASANATLGAAQLYSNSHKTVDVNNSYSGLGKGGSSSSGYSVREAVGLARQHARQKSSFPSSRAQLVDYLINRGVDASVAKKAANNMGLGRGKSQHPHRGKHS